MARPRGIHMLPQGKGSDTTWMDLASCADSSVGTDLFFPDTTSSRGGRPQGRTANQTPEERYAALQLKRARDEERLFGAAKAVCQRCLVRSDCLEYALAERIPCGIWGGMTERERTSELRRRQRAAQRARGASGDLVLD